MSDRLPGQRFQNQSLSAASPSGAEPTTPSPMGSMAVLPQRYRHNAPVLGVVIGVLVVALAAALVWAGTRPQIQNQAPSSTQSDSVTPGFTPSPNWQGIDFTADIYHSTGYWQVSPPDYQSGLVTITSTITVQKGSLRFSFFVLDNTGTNDYETVGGTLQNGTVSAGHSTTGTIVFEMPQTDFTLYLATADGVQITALLIAY